MGSCSVFLTFHSTRSTWDAALAARSEGGAVVWRMRHHQSQRRVYLGAYPGKSMHNVWKALGDSPWLLTALPRGSRRSLTWGADGGRGRVIESVGVRGNSWVWQSALGRRYQAARFTSLHSLDACKSSAPAYVVHPYPHPLFSGGRTPCQCSKRGMCRVALIRRSADRDF